MGLDASSSHLEKIYLGTTERTFSAAVCFVQQNYVRFPWAMYRLARWLGASERFDKPRTFRFLLGGKEGTNKELSSCAGEHKGNETGWWSSWLTWLLSEVLTEFIHL